MIDTSKLNNLLRQGNILLLTSKRIFKEYPLEYFGKYDQYIFTYKLPVLKKEILEVNHGGASISIYYHSDKIRGELFTLFTSKKNTKLHFWVFLDRNNPFYIDYLNTVHNRSIHRLSFKDKYIMQSSIPNQYLGGKNIQKTSKKKEQHLDLKGDLFVIKPIDGAGSQNARVVTRETLLSGNALGSINEDMIIETFLEGRLRAIDFYLSESKKVLFFSYTHEIVNFELSIDNNLEDLEIPIRYELPIESIKSSEREFLEGLIEVLINQKYFGFIHLEYKINKNNIGFIERAARSGSRRTRMYSENTGKEVTAILQDQNDFSRLLGRGDNFYCLEAIKYTYNGFIFRQVGEVEIDYMNQEKKILQHNPHISRVEITKPNKASISKVNIMFKGYLTEQYAIKLYNQIVGLILSNE